MSGEAAIQQHATFTRLLNQARLGDRAVLAQLFPLVYQELKSLAHQQRKRLHRETLDTTSLVHELYVLLKRREGDRLWANRRHFLATAALAMRCILVDYARAALSKKRGGGFRRVRFSDNEVVEATPEWVLDLDEALDQLASISPRMLEVVELRYFVGMSEQQVADQLGVSRRTVTRDWQQARALLQVLMQDPDE